MVSKESRIFSSAPLSQAALIALLLFVMYISSIHAQISTGTILGTVSDQSGGVIPGVLVGVTNAATAVKKTSVTDELGNYQIPLLPPGVYTVDAELVGFKRFARTDVVLDVNKQLRVDIQLQAGEIAESVTVQGNATSLDTETGQIGTVVENRYVVALPLVSRNVQTLKLLVPGVVDRRFADGDEFNIVSSGGLVRKDPYFIDGSYSSVHVWSGSYVNPNPDVIQEFKVLTNSFSAEWGMTSGAIMAATTKSGTNEFHGNAFEFLRNDALNARNPFVTRPLAGTNNRFKDILRYNQFGGTLGGPIRKEKTFFFADVQFTRIRGLQAFPNLSLPPLAFRKGDFSSILGPQIGTDALGRPVLRNQIFDPTTTRTITGPDGTAVVVRDPFPGNIIPERFFSPAALKIQQLFPGPQIADIFANFTGAGSTLTNRYIYGIKLDHHFSQRDTLMGRYTQQNADTVNPKPFGDAGGDTNGTSKSPSEQLALNYIHFFGPKVSNDLHFVFNRTFPHRLPTGYGKVSMADFGVNGMPNGSDKLGIPFFNIQNYARLGSTSDTLFIERQLTTALTDIASMIHGRHSLKFGAEARRYSIDNFQPIPQNGQFNFNNLHTDQRGFANTGFGYASFLLGQVNSYNYTIFPDFFQPRTSVYALFVQDDFRATKRLSLNLGLRWDGVPYWKEKNNRSGIYVFEKGENVQFGTNGFRETPWNNDWNNLGPRFGFAYDFLGNQKLVLRGGYGLFYIGVQGNGQNGFLPIAPIFADNAGGRFTSFDSVNPAFILDKIPYIPNDKTGRTLKGVTTYPDDNAMSYMQQWNLNVQTELAGLFFELGYAASKGTHMPFGAYNLNQLPLDVAAVVKDNFTSALKFPQYPGGVVVNAFLGSQIYHSLQFRGERRFHSGLGFLAAYTWQKTIATGDIGYRDIFNRNLDRGIQQDSVPHRLSVAYSYQLPFGSGRRWLNSGPVAWLGGWEVSGFTTLQGGFPLTPGLALPRCACLGGPNRPDLVGDPHLSRSERTLNRFFNTSAFAQPKSPYIQGNAGRGLLYGPGMVNFDVSLAKLFPITEGKNVEFRWEMFNATNTPLFSNPDVTVGSGNYGRILGIAGPPRQMQVALKINF